MKNSVIFTTFLASIICLLLSCTKEKDTSYKYTVTGTATTVDITYSNSSSGTSQQSAVANGWTYSWTDKDFERFLYVSAQNQGATGDVTVTIFQDDKQIKTSTSSGAYVIATASR